MNTSREQLLRKLQTMQAMTGMYQVHEKQLNQYVQHKTLEPGQTLSEYYITEDQKTAKLLGSMLLVDLEGAAELNALLPAEDLALAWQAASNEIAQLEKDRREGDKQQKHAANKRLEMLHKRQDAVQARRRALRRGLNAGSDAPAPYQTAEQGELEHGVNTWRPFKTTINNAGLGTKEDRHNKEKCRYFPSNGTKEPLEIKTNHGKLRGCSYEPPTNIRTGKVVIVFSGSGSPGASQIPDIVDSYTAAGAAVIHVDYRGYGNSESQRNGVKCGTKLCEDSLYQDGNDTLAYVLSLKDESNQPIYKPSDVILHGFSLGGAIASKVAADFAQKNAQALDRGETITEEQRLGGIVLNSAMPSMEEAADLQMKGTGGIAKSVIGSYSTRDHMRRLFQYDPNLPVHYRSGTADSDDWLGLDTTGLHMDPEATFKNSNSYLGKGSHMDTNMAHDDTHAIQKLARYGRSADLKPDLS